MRKIIRSIGASRELATAALIVAAVIVAGLREPRFLQLSTLNSVILWIPLLAVVGFGQMMVIVTRGIDVSVGSMVGLCGMAAGMAFRSQPHLNLLAGTLLAIGVGLSLGAINGAIVAYLRIPPIITTIGTLSAFRGLVFILSGGRQVDSNDLPDALTQLSLGGPIHLGTLTIPWILVIVLAIAAIASSFLTRTRAGRDIYAVGSNPEAARLRGVPVPRTIFLVYAITGGLAGLGGIFYASRFGFVNPATAGSGLELVVIAAVVIGGTNVSGGAGSVLGVLLGATLLGTINVALATLGIDATWQQLVYGAIILVAVVIDAVIRRRMSAFAIGEVAR